MAEDNMNGNDESFHIKVLGLSARHFLPQFHGVCVVSAHLHLSERA